MDRKERAQASYGRYRFVREKKNLTDYAVSKRVGIAPSTFSDWKKGRSQPKVEKLMKICELLEIPVEYLVG